MEGVAILHGEFAPAHDTEAGTDFIPELGLDLIEVHRQLPVAADFAPCDVGNHFLMRRADDEIALMTVFHAQQFRAVFVPAPGLLPQLGRLHRRHEQLKRPGTIHFFTHDLLDLAHHPQTQRHPGINATSEAADQSGPHHQLMTDQFGIGRRFFERREEKAAGTHDVMEVPESSVNFT